MAERIASVSALLPFRLRLRLRLRQITQTSALIIRFMIVAAGFPVFFSFCIFPPFFFGPYKSSFVKLLDMSLFWSDSPEVTATFSKS